MFVICTDFVMIIRVGKRRLVGHVGHREEGGDFVKCRGSLEQGCTNFAKIEEPPHNYRHKKDDMRQVPY
jgi:hypothetical protein